MFVSKVVHAYNCTQSEVTEYSRLPIDLVFHLDVSGGHETHKDYVAKWQSRMKDDYSIAT